MNAEVRPQQEVAGRILHILSIYPKISPSMLQIALNLPARVWQPVLNNMLEKKHVHRSHVVAETPAGRTHTHTILALGEEAPEEMTRRAVAMAGEQLQDGTGATI